MSDTVKEGQQPPMQPSRRRFIKLAGALAAGLAAGSLPYSSKFIYDRSSTQDTMVAGMFIPRVDNTGDAVAQYPANNIAVGIPPITSKTVSISSLNRATDFSKEPVLLWSLPYPDFPTVTFVSEK